MANVLNDLRYRLRALFDRDRLERDLDDELRAHLERETERNIALGMSRQDAARRAQIAFGGVDRIKDESRDARGTVFIETLAQDFDTRSESPRATNVHVRRRPHARAGIGANAAMFSIVDRLLLRPPSYLRDAGRVHRVYLEWTRDRELQIDRNTQFARYLDLLQSTRTLSSIAAFSTMRFAVGDGVDAVERPVTVASATYFEFFDARAVIGRLIGSADDVPPAGSPVAVWATRSGRRSSPVRATCSAARCTSGR